MRTILINIGAVLGLLVMLEAAVRLVGPDIPPTGTDRSLIADSVYGSSAGLRPGATGESNGALFTVGPDGFWQYYGTSTSEGPGWLFLGDSVTMGIGVEPDSTFAGRVAASGVRVLNPSLIGYAVDDYGRVLRAVLGREAPERVTLFWCLNDIYLGNAAAGDPGGRVRVLGGPVLRFVQRHYRTYQLAKAIVLDRPRSYLEYASRQYDERAVAEAASRIAAMAREAAAAGAAFDVVLLPYEYQLREQGRFGPQAMLEARLTADSIRVFDASGFLLSSGIDPSELYLFGDGIHFSTTGHALLARLIRERL